MNPLMSAQMLAHMAIGERKLDYYAMGSCFEKRMNVGIAKLEATKLILPVAAVARRIRDAVRPQVRILSLRRERRGW